MNQAPTALIVVFVGLVIDCAFGISVFGQGLPHADHSVIDTDYLPEELDELDPGEHAWHCWVKVQNDEATLDIKANLFVYVQQKVNGNWTDISGPHSDVALSISPGNSEWLKVGDVDEMSEGQFRYRWTVLCAEILTPPDEFGGPGTTVGPELNGWIVEDD